MCVRALRITILKSAGNFTRDECHDLSAEKIQRVKCLCSRGAEFVACWQFSNAGPAGRVRKFQAGGQLAEVAVYFAMSGLSPIVLQNSFWVAEDKFSEPWVWRSNNYLEG
jgi:hypothetical protein